MNPVPLTPTGERRSQVIVLDHAVGVPGVTDEVGAPLRPHPRPDGAATDRHAHPHGAGARA